MIHSDGGTRDQQPTPRRLEEARAAGMAPRSRDLCAATVLLAAAALAAAGGPRLWSTATRLWELVETGPLKPGAVVSAEQARALPEVAVAVAVVLGLACAAAAISNLLQFGFRVTPDVVRPQWTRIHPRRAVANGPGTAFQAILSACKFVLVFAIVACALVGCTERIQQMAFTEPGEIAAGIGALVARTCLWLSAGLLVVALADVAWQRWRYRIGLRMTRQEVLDEGRQATRRGGRPPGHGTTPRLAESQAVTRAE